MRYVAATSLLFLLGTLGGGLPVRAEEPADELVGVYELDREAHARALLAHWRVVREAQAASRPEGYVEPPESVMEENALRSAQATTVFLDLRRDATFLATWQTPMGSGPDVYAKLSGTWERGAKNLRVTVSLREGNGWASWLEEGTHEVEIHATHLVLPFRTSEWDVPFRLRRLPERLAVLVRASPAERGRLVRGGLPPPDAQQAFSFHGEALAAGTGAAAVVGTMRISAEPTSFEGTPAWLVTVVNEGVGVCGASGKRAWLAQDLGVLRLETDEPDPDQCSEPDPGAVRQRVVTRSANGYRTQVTGSGADARGLEIETAEAPVSTLGALLLFLRACPDLALAYEIPYLEGDRIRTSSIEVEGMAPAFRGMDTEVAPLGWMARADGQRIECTQAERRPVMFGMGGMYGVLIFAEPGLLSVYDLSGISLPPASAQQAAWAYALATLRGDRNVLEQVLDFDALWTQAKVLGHSTEAGGFREELLAKLERRRLALLPGERARILRVLTRGKGVEIEGAGTRVKLYAPGEDFEVVAREGAAGWKVCTLLPSIYDETLCCGDEWTDSSRPEPVHDGRRLWMARRELLAPSRESVMEAVYALARMGKDGTAVLMEALYREHPEEDDHGLGHAVPEALGRLGMDVLPTLLEDYAKANDRRRSRLDEVAKYLGNERAWRPAAADPAKQLPLLLQALAAEWPAIRTFVVSALGQIGPSAAEALPALEALRSQPQAQTDRRFALFLKGAVRELGKREIRIPVASTPPGIPEQADEFDGGPSRSWHVTLTPAAEGRRRPIRLFDSVGGRDWIRVVGTFEPGTYLVEVSSAGWAPVILGDVELTRRVTTLDPIHVTAGSTVTLHLQRDSAPDAERVWAEATFQGTPRRRATGHPDQRTPHQIVFRGLGAGSYRLIVRVVKRRDPAFDKTITVDGESDVNVDVDL